MKTTLKLISVIAIIAIGIFFGAYNHTKVEKVGSNFGVGTISNNRVIMGTKSGTNAFSAPTYFNTSTPTTTITYSLGNAMDTADLNICAIASSTDSVVYWQYGFSEDGTNFYWQDDYSVSSGSVVHSATSTIHQWTPGTTSNICKNITIDGLNTKSLRLLFYRGSGATSAQNFSLYGELNSTDKQ